MPISILRILRNRPVRGGCACWDALNETRKSMLKQAVARSALRADEKIQLPFAAALEGARDGKLAIATPAATAATDAAPRSAKV